MNQPPKARVFLEGRYRKLVRDLPQTVFFCPDCKGHPRRRHGCERCEGFGKLTRDSVQELVAWVACKAFRTRKHKFHGAGREDIDVRMLGSGRPFVLELLGPKAFEIDLAELESEINKRNEGRLEIRGLHWSEKPRVRTIKESPHAKEYEALVAVDALPSPERVSSVIGERIEVAQRTPGRVAHRRADKERKRWIEVLSIEPADPSEAKDAGVELPAGRSLLRIDLRTEHGTYVKEVLSGDEGKTIPSLSDLLGVRCECVALDVLAILTSEGEPDPELHAPRPFGSGVYHE